MTDIDWIERLLPHEAETALERITAAMDRPLSAREATDLHRIQKVLRAKAESTHEPDA
ncbi:MAG: hypothetical protein WAK90_05455 [Pseudolabrys sp.]